MTWDHFAPLVSKYRTKGLLIDTNVLLLLLVGSVEPRLIRTSKITNNQGFTEADFELLQIFVGNFKKVVTTPHILAEVSNHAGKMPANQQTVFCRLASLIERIEEHAEAATSLVQSDAFARFGLTDTAIGALASKGFLVLTVDFPLAGYLEKRGVDAINFNHLRQLNWEQ